MKTIRKQINEHADRQPPQQIHKVLNAVFKYFRPDVFLRAEMKGRNGLTDEIIDQYILAAPSGEIVQWLQEEQGFTDEDLLGVPGFFQDEAGFVQLKQHINVDYGIAVRSINQKIQGILLHFPQLFKTANDKPENEFAWLSTNGAWMGTPSGSPIGMVGNPREYMYYDVVERKRRLGTEIELGKRGNIFITDSFLKAAACHQKYGTRALFMTGVHNETSLPRTLESLCRKSGSRQKVIIAPDAIWKTDSGIMTSWLNIVEKIYSQCLPIWVAVWEPIYGTQIDAVIRNGNADKITPKRISKEFLPYIYRWAERQESKNSIAKTMRPYADYVWRLIADWEK